MPNSKASPAKTAAPRGGENNAGKNLAERLYAAFRSSGVDFEIVVPPRRGKKRERTMPHFVIR